MIDYSWVKLKGKCPMDISEVVKHAESIETILKQQVVKNRIEDYKERLILASGELEIMISKLITLLYNIDTIKSDVDKAVFSFMKDDLSGYIAMIDDKQNKLLEVHDGQLLSGVGRTSAFKKIISVALYGIIYHSLNYTSNEFNSIKRDEGIEKDMRTFLRIFFLILSINLSTLGGLPRRKSSGGLLKTEYKPSSWRAMFTQGGESEIREEHNDRYGSNPTFDNVNFDFDEEKEDGSN